MYVLLAPACERTGKEDEGPDVGKMTPFYLIVIHQSMLSEAVITWITLF